MTEEGDAARVGSRGDVDDPATRERVVQALEAAREGIALLDENGEFIYVNRAYADTFGYEPSAMVGEHWDDLGIEADPDRFYDDILPDITTDGQWTGTTHCVHSDGSEFLAQHTLTYTDRGEFICVVRDISQREQRRQSLQQYAKIVETVDDGIFALDDDSRFTLVNDAFCEMFGYDRAELLGSHASLVHSETMDERASEKVREMRDGERDAAVMDVEIATRDGDIVPVESWIAPLPFGDGSYGRVGVVRDVSERRERERKLRETREQLEIATTAGSVGTWTWDIQANVVTADEYLAESYGMDPAAAAAGGPMEAFYEPIHEDDTKRTWNALERAVEETGELDVEYRIRDADGDISWVLARGTVVYDENDDPIRLNGIVFDITERKRTEERVRFLEELGQKLQSLTDPDELMATAARFLGEHLGVDRCAYAQVEADENHVRITGDYTRGGTESIEGEWATSSFGADVLEAMRENRTVVVDDVATDDRVPDERLAAYERAQVRSAISVPLHKDGAFVAGLGVHHRTPREWQPHEIELVETVAQRCWESLERARTLQELRERERQLEATVEDLEETNERLDGFASMLAHELRNPVAIGQMYRQQLPEAEAPQAVEHVGDAFDRIEEMIDVMLVLTGGQQASDDRTRVALESVSRDAWGEVNTPDASLEVSLDTAVHADETYLRHLFRNLFENAIEHGGDAVTVTVGELPTGFYVEDDGSGIPAEKREAVFEAGYTTASAHGGTGLGLAFVEELVDLYDWECTVTESGAGGARFEFRNVV
ncbi:PAS domain-containing sensor histidine kinase [Haloarcula nitratireducens]|uniref:histidine kinase n=1 Tax=Haloarcula nitratireducens TaxID=2487749 RepID=A0AAW4PBY4_9EURY|nr:PAS domain S-box protein [Halomicroarcula nitratireducens]MBX0295093.1 PAS domain S-box protein [Halomicroarcula nitratireducens]